MKRVFRYFFDFTDGQQKWLNDMAAKGWRLIKCSQLTYDFESCIPGEYEYAVEFVADKSYSKSKDYKSFLETMGYKTFYKSINVGISIGKVKWRPWGEGAGQISTAPGSFQKELLLVEKRNDGKPFELHTDLTDSLMIHNKICSAYFWSIGGMFALTTMLLFYAVWMKSIYMAVGAVVCGSLGFLWLKPALKILTIIHKLKEKAETNEYEAPLVKKKAWNLTAMLAFPSLIVLIVFGMLYFSGIALDSYSAQSMVQTSWGGHWDASYSYLNGYKQRRVSLNEGTHTFTIEVTTKSGALDLSIVGQDGTEYYRGSEILTTSFEVQVHLSSKDKLTLRVDANNHSGSYKIRWE